MDASRFVRGLLDDQEDPQQPQYVPANDFPARTYGLLDQLLPDPYKAAGDAVKQYQGGDVLGAFETMFGGMPTTGALKAKAAPSIASLSGGRDTAAVGRARDERFWHPISTTKLSRPIGEMHADHVFEAPPTSPKIIQPEDLEGAALIPALGDRSAGGSLLTSVNEQRLENPTQMQAGHSFMYGPASAGADKAVWASDPGIISRLAKRARFEADQGFDPHLSYTAMSNRSADYSHHMTDTLLDLMNSAKVKGDDVKEFDRQMRENTANKWEAYTDFPGLLSENIQDYLYGSGPAKARTKLAELMGQGQFQKAGFPDVGATRFAITDPGLLNAADYSSGRSIAKLDPAGKIITDPVIPHKTYKHQLGGEYAGGFLSDIPFEVMNKEWIDGKMAEDAKKYSNPSMLAYTYRLESPTVRMTPQVVDRLSEYLRLNPR
jgi:hypothetical protein